MLAPLKERTEQTLSTLPEKRKKSLSPAEIAESKLKEKVLTPRQTIEKEKRLKRNREQYAEMLAKLKAIKGSQKGEGKRKTRRMKKRKTKKIRKLKRKSYHRKRKSRSKRKTRRRRKK